MDLMGCKNHEYNDFGTIITQLQLQEAHIKYHPLQIKTMYFDHGFTYP
jgi:hypothetical protein